MSGGTIWYGSTFGRAEVVKRIRHLKPVSSFRSQFAYQNIMYLVAGQLIPAVTGIDWDTFVQERLFKPLDMTDSVTSITAFKPDENVVTPHITVDGQAQVVAHRNYDNVGPAASIYSSVVDMAQYLRLHLQQGRSADQQLLSPATAQELVDDRRWSFPSDRIRQPSRLSRPSSTRMVWVGSFATIAGGKWSRIRAESMVWSHWPPWCLKKSWGLWHWSIRKARWSRLSSIRCWMFISVRLRPIGMTPFSKSGAKPLKKSVPLGPHSRTRVCKETQPALALEHYAGTYHADVYGEASVTLEDGHLVLRFSQTPSFTGDLEHWHYETFRIHWRDPMVTTGLVTFPLTAQGKPFEMKFDQPKLLDVDFSELEFTRVPATGRPD